MFVVVPMHEKKKMSVVKRSMMRVFERLLFDWYASKILVSSRRQKLHRYAVRIDKGLTNKVIRIKPPLILIAASVNLLAGFALWQLLRLFSLLWWLLRTDQEEQTVVKNPQHVLFDMLRIVNSVSKGVNFQALTQTALSAYSLPAMLTLWFHPTNSHLPLLWLGWVNQWNQTRKGKKEARRFQPAYYSIQRQIFRRSRHSNVSNLAETHKSSKHLFPQRIESKETSSHSQIDFAMVLMRETR